MTGLQQAGAISAQPHHKLTDNAEDIIERGQGEQNPRGSPEFRAINGKWDSVYDFFGFPWGFPGGGYSQGS